MDDVAFDRVSRSANRFLSRRATLGMLAGGGLAALQGMGLAADAKRHKRRHQPLKTCTVFREACVSDNECCNKDFTSCDVTDASSAKVCCFSLGTLNCTSDADCCGANTVCSHHACAQA